MICCDYYSKNHRQLPSYFRRINDECLQSLSHQIHNEVIEAIAMKLLGIMIIDSKLNFEDHNLSLCHEASIQLNALIAFEMYGKKKRELWFSLSQFYLPLPMGINTEKSIEIVYISKKNAQWNKKDQGLQPKVSCENT